jgi:hypothetical protein
MMLGGAAYAGTAYQGADYSYSTDSNRRAVVCDKEADGRTAYVHYSTWESTSTIRRVNDLDGSSGYCWQGPQYASGIYKHRTCEDINNAPDACSEYSSGSSHPQQ